MSHHKISTSMVLIFFTALFSVGAAASYRVVNAAHPSANGPPPVTWYYVGDEKVTLPLATDALIVVYEADLSLPEVDNLGREIKTIAPVAGMKEILKPEQKLVEFDSRVGEARLLNIRDELRIKPGVRSVHPVFDLGDTRMTVTEQFIAQFKTNASMEDIQAFNSKNNVEVIEETLLSNTYILRVGSGADTVGTANLYHESDLTVYASPDFIRFIKKEFIPNDTYFPSQWGLENSGGNSPGGSGTLDADMDTSSAWNISRGDSGTVIAIIDEGVQLNHPDLNDKIVNPHTEVLNDSSANPNNSWDAHGTNVAGIAAAETNNSQGVAGVCPDCALMPVQIAYSSSQNDIYWVSYESWIANGISWAWNNGADVLSNSWGMNPEFPSTPITNAITDAINKGRGGLGSVVLFAAGNDNENSLPFPAGNQLVIAVGATSPCDQRKSPSSCDGEPWGSNYGNGLDVVAPGVKWWSTDMTGSAGYASGDYFSSMNGTSSATPAAAGVAALIISYRPCLTGPQVKNILQASADDQVGPSNEDTTSWDQYMGWGRVNAHEALIEAGKYSCGGDNYQIFIPFTVQE